MLSQQAQHPMQLATVHPSGAEEWACATCGRRFVLQWARTYKKIVLAEGDLAVAHHGTKGEYLVMGAVQLQSNAERAEAHDEEVLEPWSEWLEDVDFNDWGDERE